MSRIKEYIGPAGLRLDGRRPLESRPWSLQFGTLSGCDGSCTLQIGRTKLCACVIGPKESDSRQESQSEGLITCEVALAAFAQDGRRNPQRRNKMCDDIRAAVEQVLRSVVLRSQYPNSQIHVFVEILQQDGNEKAASINAACLALVDANIAMRDAVVCVDAGYVDGTVLIDLTTDEIRSKCASLTAAYLAHDVSKILWMESCARLSTETMGEMIHHTEESASTTFSTCLEAALVHHASLGAPLNK